MKRELSLALAISALLIAPAFAQGRRGGDNDGGDQGGGGGRQRGGDTNAPADPNAPRPPSIFNDPQVRLLGLRAQLTGQGGMGMMFGGRGGGPPGGGGGPGGQSSATSIVSLLLRYPALQEEIELTEEQKQKLEKIGQIVNDRRGEIFEQMRGQRGQRGQDNGGRPSFDFNVLGEEMRKMASQSETEIRKILTKDQIERLNQIALQIEGPTAVARPEIAAKVNLSPSQRTQVSLLMENMKTQQAQMAQTQMEAMRARFQQGGGPGGPGGPGFQPGGPGGPGFQPGGNTRFGAQPANGQTPAVAGRGQQQPGQPGPGGQAPGGAAPTNNNNSRGGFDREAMMSSMQKGIEVQLAMLKAADQQVSKILTARQKQTFNKLIGEPYDLEKLVESQDRGGRGGGRPAPPAEETKAAAPAEGDAPAPAEAAPVAPRP